jgi:hypothetical protein
MANGPTRVFDIFTACDQAIAAGQLIQRESSKDKEYHFQDWFKNRLQEAELQWDDPGRNSYPDIRLIHTPEGFELKALAYPGRQASFDANSQVPTGQHRGRTVFYVFGRYPRDAAKTERQYPLIDLVICHGDFLNADHSYAHKNDSVRGFGSYGDILIRDRKMYVAPTPFALLEGVTSLPTLVLPEDYELDARFQVVGQFSRVETDRLVVGYTFDLKHNRLKPEYVKNPDAGREHSFVACRLSGSSNKPVSLVPNPVLPDVHDDGE